MRIARLFTGLLFSASVIVMLVGLQPPTGSQDNHEQRISVLEARVTLLEATVAALSGSRVEPSPTPRPSVETIRGSIELKGIEGPDYRITPSGCYGVYGNDDYVIFADVFVLNANREVVGQGKLEDGRAGPVSKTCKWYFDVAFEVGKPPQTYMLVVGRPDGDSVYSFDQSNWPGPGEFVQITVEAR